MSIDLPASPAKPDGPRNPYLPKPYVETTPWIIRALMGSAAFCVLMLVIGVFAIFAFPYYALRGWWYNTNGTLRRFSVLSDLYHWSPWWTIVSFMMADHLLVKKQPPNTLYIDETNSPTPFGLTGRPVKDEEE